MSTDVVKEFFEAHTDELIHPNKTIPTHVINLFGAPSSGKSTAAAGIFYNLKMQHKHCEMVREYVKSWAWEGRKPGQYDQLYLLGKQAKYESLLYGKVDYIITDSPLIISGFYEHWHDDSSLVLNAAENFMVRAINNGVTYHNFWLPAHEHYDSRGRYHSKEDSDKLGKPMLEWLRNQLEGNIEELNDVEDRVGHIINSCVK